MDLGRSQRIKKLLCYKIVLAIQFQDNKIKYKALTHFSILHPLRSSCSPDIHRLDWCNAMQISHTTVNAYCAQAHANCTKTHNRQEVQVACQYKCQCMCQKIPGLNQTEPELQIPGHAEKSSVRLAVAEKEKAAHQNHSTLCLFLTLHPPALMLQLRHSSRQSI